MARGLKQLAHEADDCTAPKVARDAGGAQRGIVRPDGMGVGLARGYLNRAGLNRVSLVSNVKAER